MEALPVLGDDSWYPRRVGFPMKQHVGGDDSVRKLKAEEQKRRPAATGAAVMAAGKGNHPSVNGQNHTEEMEVDVEDKSRGSATPVSCNGDVDDGDAASSRGTSPPATRIEQTDVSSVATPTTGSDENGESEPVDSADSGSKGSKVSDAKETLVAHTRAGVEVREKSPCSPRVNGNVIEPEVSIEIVSVASGGAVSAKQSPAAVDTPIDNAAAAADDDDDEPPALVVDEGDAAEPQKPTNTASSDDRKLVTSPTPDVKIVQIRGATDGLTGTKRSISPTVSVTKKIKVSENSDASSNGPPERLPNIKDMDQLEKMLLSVRRDIRSLDTQVKEKEREWNHLIVQKKKMEEYYVRLKRKREVETLELTGSLSTTPTVAPVVTSISKVEKSDNTVSIVAGMSGGKVKTQETSMVTPRAMTITPDMLYGGAKGKPGSMAAVAQSAAAAAAKSHSGRRWRPTTTQQQQQQQQTTTSPVVVTSGKSTASQQEIMKMYSEIVRQQHNSYQQAEKLQQALTGRLAALTPQPSQLQQALGLGSAEQAAAAAVAAATAAAAAASRRGVSVRPGQDTPTTAALTSLLEASRQSSERSSSKSGKSNISGGTVSISATNNEKNKSKDTGKNADVPPTCHGCKQRIAQFVCAGCNSQWYCSRECQIRDWDEHAEHCTA
ncbi:unnamed protein product [Notodromas monacha]|uniref:MYND-type domain-containing protein n=1 Tax=Notodromas monacha TaxID=399045 RepID=A0A7R9GI77_9CRUS|nr:unnamed protein product [Notodromas monacha]CAG0923666.1 unnamed protein product [Notodromas monacha]